MELIQPYRGTYVSAKSASKDLDVESILKGCDAVEEEAKGIGESANKLSSAASPMDEKALFLDSTTVLPMVGEYCEQIHMVEIGIVDIVDQVRELVVDHYNRIQEDLNQEAKTADTAEKYKRRGGR